MSFTFPEGGKEIDAEAKAYVVQYSYMAGLVVLKGSLLRVLASNGGGWEHVSVSLPHRCPTWDEMNYIKDIFWGPEDCVVQYHPPRSKYVNIHPFCLHLWREIGKEFRQPPAY